MRSLTICLTVGLILLVAAGCVPTDLSSGGTVGSINVVTTIFPLADILEELGGEWVSVSYLLPTGASPHTYEPTVKQARAIAEAHLFVYVGAGLDDWASKLAEAAGTELAVIELAGALALREPGSSIRLDNVCQAEHHHDHAHNECTEEHHCHSHHGPVDPHFWLDPLLVRDLLCPLLHDELAARLPEHTAYLEARLNEYTLQLTLLHEEIESAVAGFNSHAFITFHSAWRYFGERYGLREMAVIAQFPGQEPPPGWIAELIGLIREKNVGAILTEPQFSSTLAERIAEESGIELLLVDPLGGEKVPGRESYLELMRFNLNAFARALQ